MPPSYLPPGYFLDVATVYTEGVTGAFDVVAQTNLACRLDGVPTGDRADAVGGFRAEESGVRDLRWSPTYVMPSDWEVAIAGRRWSPQLASRTDDRTHAGVITQHRCRVVELLTT